VVNRVGGGIALYLYHFPQQSAVPFGLPLLERLLKAFPGVIKGVKDSTGDYANSKAMVDAFAKDGFEVYPGADNLFQRLLADGAAGCITAAANVSARFSQIVYRNRTGPEADAAQAVLNAGRQAATAVPLIPGLREIIARCTGHDGWRTIRPPHLPLTAAEGQKAWDAMQAAGVLPLPGLGLKAAAE
jgi:4-hydroxy-tetrahydrodipicolinate synthase